MEQLNPKYQHKHLKYIYIRYSILSAKLACIYKDCSSCNLRHCVVALLLQIVLSHCIHSHDDQGDDQHYDDYYQHRHDNDVRKTVVENQRLTFSACCCIRRRCRISSCDNDHNEVPVRHTQTQWILSLPLYRTTSLMATSHGAS